MSLEAVLDQRGHHKHIELDKVMHSSVSVTPDAPARDALKVMLDNKVPGVPVVNEDGKVEGFISDGHLLESALPKYIKMMDNLSFVTDKADEWVNYLTEASDRPVREIMTEEVSKIKLGKSEFAAAHKMIRDGVSSVVIVDEDEKMVGIVNRLDLYAAIVGVE